MLKESRARPPAVAPDGGRRLETGHPRSFARPMRRPTLWIALTRPDNLVTALAIARAGRERFAACRLLYENSSWWARLDPALYAPRFDRVDSVERIPTCRGLLDLPRFSRALHTRQRQLTDLRIGPADTIVTLAGITKLSIALASAYPGVNKVLCATVKKYADASRPWSWARYRPTTAGWLQRWLVEPRVGLRRTVRLKSWRGGGDGVRLERPEEPLAQIFQTILLLSNDGAELPDTAGPNAYPSPFPSLRDLGDWLPAPAVGDSSDPAVVFFGTPFLLVRNLAPEIYRARLNACLQAIRRWHGADCQLIYRPHPAETREREGLDLAGFVVEEDGQVAELYFLRNFRRLRAVFSVSSTVSRVALNYGLNAYTLWRCFPFDKPAVRYFTTLMGRVPPEFDVRSLDQPPITYAVAATNRPTTFREATQSALRP